LTELAFKPSLAGEGLGEEIKKTFFLILFAFSNKEKKRFAKENCLTSPHPTLSSRRGLQSGTHHFSLSTYILYYKKKERHLASPFSALYNVSFAQ